MSQVNVSHLTFDNDNTIYNLEDETARAEITALHVELTQAEYDTLTPEEKNNGTEYFITDSTDSGDFSYLENRLSVLDGKSNTLNEIATLEVTDVKGIIHSSASPKYTFIKNKGENDCYISATDDVGEGVDGTILLQSNSTIMLENVSDVNYICKSGKTTVICVYFQNSVNDPFTRVESSGSSGGGSGTLGIEEVVLWEYTGSKPTTMVLSQPVTDFDVIITYGADNGNEYAFQPTVHLVSEIQKGLLFGAGIVNSDARQWYDYVNATTFEINRFMNKPYLPIKVVGVKLSSGGEGSTKTTNYSTDEQVIGTWIDGSILYQKTYTGISLNNNSWNHGIIDLAGKAVCDIRGYITSEKIGAVDINYYRSGSEFVTTIWDSPSLSILPNLSASDFGTLTATITIQYTKSSA